MRLASEYACVSPTTLHILTCSPKPHRSPGFSLSLLTQSTTSSSHYAESHSKPGAIPEDVASEAVNSLLSSLSTRGCIPPPLQPHTLLLMAASPEDVSRVRMGMFNPSAVQMCRDIESVWGVRFLIRPVEEHKEQHENEGEDEHTAASAVPEFVLSCRGVGIRGHRKAT